MKSFRSHKKGQFVVIAALIIAALTLTTIVSVYEISLNSQSIAYKPVDEFLLGVTSDMNRALTVALSTYTTGIHRDQLEQTANQSAQQFMKNWQQALLTGYPNYGLRFNQPMNFYFECKWQQNPGYSSALGTYDFDVASYGFIGWSGETIKYVQLELFPNISNNGQTSTVTFQLTESIISSSRTVPIPNLPTNPSTSNFVVTAYQPSPQYNPVSSNPTLTYQGDGVYKATFNQVLDPTLGVTISLATPEDGIWVSATLPAFPNNRTNGDRLNPTLLTTPPTNATAGQAFSDSATLIGCTIRAGGTVTYTLYRGVYPEGVKVGTPSTVSVIDGIVPNSGPFTVNAVGPYYFIAEYSGDSNNNPCTGEPEPFNVKKASSSSGLSLITNQPIAVTVGTSFNDKAKLEGATSDAGGTVTYTLYYGVYPNGNPCGSSQVTVTNSQVPNSAPFTVNTAGPYYFLAEYSGDANNDPVLGSPEPFTAYSASAGLILVTRPPAEVTVGSSFCDQAVLINAPAGAGGTVTYILYSGQSGGGTQIGTSTVTVTNGQVPNSDLFTVNSAGSYYFVAKYSNGSKGYTLIGEPEPFTVSPTSPATGLNLQTAPPYGALINTDFFDQSALTGVTSNAGGTVTYTLYRGLPGSGIQVGSSSQVTVTNGFVPVSANFAVDTIGAYYFLASYSGDANNEGCVSGPEQFTVASPQGSNGLVFYFNSTNTQNGYIENIGPPTSSQKLNAYISNGQTTQTTTSIKPTDSDMTIHNIVTAVLFIGTSQPINQLNAELGFFYQDQYYKIGSTNLYDIPQNVANKPYGLTFIIDVGSQGLVPGYPALTIPGGSYLTFNLTAGTSSNPYTGRITIYYGPGQLSRIAL